jgi:TRAP-type C4-dicarboxylate transport system permease small subunit
MERLAFWCLSVAGLALFMIVLVQAWQVIARYLLNDSPGWTEPVSTLLLGTLMSLSAAAGVHYHSHFDFGLLIDRCSSTTQRWVSKLKLLCISALGLTVFVWSGILALDGASTRQAGVGLSVGAMYWPSTVGGALMAVFALAHLGARAKPQANDQNSIDFVQANHARKSNTSIGQP